MLCYLIEEYFVDMMREFVEELKCKIEDADMVLIGLGEEFECRKELMQDERYAAIYNEIRENDFEWIFPYLNYYFIKKIKPDVLEGLRKLAERIQDKPYFLVTTICNDIILDTGFDKERIVSPCGGFYKMQPLKGDEKKIVDTDKSTLKVLDEYFEGEKTLDELKQHVFNVENPMVFNSILINNYDEDGYLADWERYTKWLQRTLNKKICVIELGVGMNFPSIIRWPFEKIAFFNQKASFFRVHKSLYQISKELHGKGWGLEENASSFICVLD